MRVLIFTVTALLLLQADTRAASGSCCDDHKCATAACCKHHSDDVALEPMETALSVVTPGLEWPTEDARPARELATVLFREPVRVGDRILLGRYVIEHDKERMAQGRPCTHIYAADDLQLPVVAFHCRHLVRESGPRSTVTLIRLPDGSPRMFKLTEFQFQGSTEGHGVPAER